MTQKCSVIDVEESCIEKILNFQVETENLIRIQSYKSQVGFKQG